MKPLFLILLLIVITSGCAIGNKLVTGTAKPATAPSAVKIFSDMPTNAEVIGLVSSKGSTMDLAIDEIKRQASLMGATGVFVTKFSGDGMRASRVEGKAFSEK